ncbi:variant erythrocyte surface antigen-1 family protein [Babesia caballi]|uniref:Variant erythrocyte surface antigen-1 family protein n=1 Tax=Babesia caballi TaxID=5871 RepID=A0AAV4LWQ1_BABCB|nr:variant erythrocyte surface antigen-1 family protein [Babesia caballi]
MLPLDSPLSALVELSFGCPSNLREAIDWILRVTGKDGQQSGGQAINALTKEVKSLLNEVRDFGTGFKKDAFDKVMSALSTGSGNDLITKLADGLQQFIGYQSGNTKGLITGAGIAPSNIATHRLCDATIAFTIGVLEGCKHHLRAPNYSNHRKKLDGVINKLHEKYGQGPEGLEEVAATFGTELNGSSWGHLNGFLEDLKTALTNLNGLQSQPDKVANNIGKYFQRIYNSWGESNNSTGTTVSNQLSSLGSSLNAGATYDPSSVKGQINQVGEQLKPTKRGDVIRIKDALTAGQKAFLAVLRNDNYTSYYKETDTTSIDTPTCAKIFLSCIPLYYQAFTYIYWRCNSSGNGEWETQTFDGSKGHHLKYFMFSMNYEASYLNNRRGSDVVGGAVKSFADFDEGMNQAQQEATRRTQAASEAIKQIYSGAQASTSNQKPTYPEFLAELQKKFTETIKNPHTQGNSLAALYYCALCYFKCQQQKNVTKAVKTPSTIREMLYYLAAFPFSPNYDAFNTYVTDHFKKLSKSESTAEYDAALMIQVADSGISTEATEKSGGNTLSAADIKDYLTEISMFSMSALGWLQGPGASKKPDEPWLHELFSNSAFQFKYPSGAILFSTLSNCTYALQFQLGFLFSTCANNGMKCGWQECRYGEEIEPKQNSKTLVSSHICHAGCNHGTGGSSGPCQAHEGTNCGTDDKASPLQAFLTDNLKGFSRSHLSTSDHIASCSANSMCHVPMGLQATHLRQNSGTGNHIYSALYSFCGTSSSPLRQLCEKLGCLTKRTPRTLGDLFGFTWHLNGQLFNNADMVNKLKEALGKRPTSVDNFIGELTQLASSLKPSPGDSGIVKSLQTMGPAIPFLYQLFTVKPDDFLPVTLFNLAQHCHTVENSNGSFKILHKNPSNSVVTSIHNCSSSPNDLWSLCQPVKAKPSGGGSDTHAACRGKDCGPYLSPLTHSSGATYAPVHASVYLSWLAYLTDDFHEWFQNLLVEFNNIDCTKTGCRAKAGGKKCSKPHQPGTHGTSDTCSCDSVVHCGGVLPVLYRHGFQFYSPHTLSGGKDGGNETKRDCQKFHNALFNVLAEGAPLTKLLESIDEFLYLFRFYFLYNQSAFWTIYICIILYTFLFLLDTLRVRSHLHFPSANSIAPISLLGTAKAPALKKFTKLTYFMP